MILNEWNLFKNAFKQYAMETPGILTLNEPISLKYLNLDRFLDVCSTSSSLSITQVDVLMALATYLDIVNVDLSVFPPMVLRQMNGLTQRGILQLNPFSDLRIHLRTENQAFAFVECAIAARARSASVE